MNHNTWELVRPQRSRNGSPGTVRKIGNVEGVDKSNVFAVLIGNQQEDPMVAFLKETTSRRKASEVESSPSLTLNEYPILERQRPQ